MYPAGNLFIPVRHGRLEAIIKEPKYPRNGVALVLHPHPLGGGTMHNKVVFRAAAALNDAGLLVLRINFRGVGQSTGEHDEGRGEREDVRAGLNYLSENFPSEAITLCGFSFGARVGLEVGIGDARVNNLISIGTPVDKYDFTFLEKNRKPILFVHCANDEFGDPNHLKDLVESISTNAPAQLKIIDGCGHFFDGRLEQLKQIISEWIGRHTKTDQLVEG
ncbi:MAG TPA: alpha/beta fold hydrolase [Pyrinomonadaceae bacterium]|nr:alpha/beta fold hydrolase [Pyrinomonadaceae bacterium]